MDYTENQENNEMAVEDSFMPVREDKIALLRSEINALRSEVEELKEKVDKINIAKISSGGVPKVGSDKAVIIYQSFLADLNIDDLMEKYDISKQTAMSIVRGRTYRSHTEELCPTGNFPGIDQSTVNLIEMYIISKCWSISKVAKKIKKGNLAELSDDERKNLVAAVVYGVVRATK